MGLASWFVYQIGADRKREQEAITATFAQRDKDLESLRADMHERFEMAGKRASDIGDRMQSAVGKIEARFDNECDTRRTDIERLSVDLGKIQLVCAVIDQRLITVEKIVDRREHDYPRREEDR